MKQAFTYPSFRVHDALRVDDALPQQAVLDTTASGAANRAVLAIRRHACSTMMNMTNYGAKELADSFRTVRKNTIQIATEIPEDQYGFQPAPGSRTIGQTLVHIAVGFRLAEQFHMVEKRATLEGFDFPAFFGKIIAEEQQPRTKPEVIALLTESGAKFGDFLEGLSDEFLSERVTMPAGMQPESKSRIEMLMSGKEHEMHHRGQLMLAERMLGLTPHLTREMQARMASMTTKG